MTYDMPDRNFALNSVDAIDDESPQIVEAVQQLYDEKAGTVEGFARYSEYDFLMSEYLLRKWGILEEQTEA